MAILVPLTLWEFGMHHNIMYLYKIHKMHKEGGGAMSHKTKSDSKVNLLNFKL